MGAMHLESNTERGGPEEAEDPPPPRKPLRRRGLIPRELLDEQAVFVVRRLQREGHEAYLVGGCVRDLLAGLEPKDFDLATDARPNRIKRLFRSARVIGRRFRLVHVRFPGDHVIEVATFRGDPASHEPRPETPPAESDRGRRGRNWRDSAENVFGTAPEDARRRDFTINALFYDPIEDEVIDWVGGLEDMKRGVIRSIGSPAERLQEDPVRMLRAVHFAQRLGFDLEPALEQAIREQARTLDEASQARLYVELVKMLSRGRAHGTFHRLHELGVLSIWLPELAAFLDQPVAWPRDAGGTHEEASRGEPVDVPPAHATWNLLGAADRWGLAAHKTPESLALAVLFGPWLRAEWRLASGDGAQNVIRRAGIGAFVAHAEETFRPVAVRMSVPRWACMQMRDLLWMLDELRDPPPPKRAARLMHRPGFAVALAFFELDLISRDQDTSPVDRWRQLADQEGVRLHFEKPSVPRQRGGRRGSGRRGGRQRQSGRGGRRPRGHQRPAVDPSGPEAGAWLPPPPE